MNAVVIVALAVRVQLVRNRHANNQRTIKTNYQRRT